MNSSETIILVYGSGKAAVLHINAIISIWEPKHCPKIFIKAGVTVDPEICCIISIKKYPITFVSDDIIASLETHKTLIDICTPTTTHKQVILNAISLGFKKFIVEKPFVITDTDLIWAQSLNVQIEIVENYLHSQATVYVKEYFNQKNIRPVELFSFFCKNRIDDCKNNRGYHKNIPPHIFTVELPHQIYLATSLFGETEFISSEYEGMFTGNRFLPNLGAGYIELAHNIGDNTRINGRSFHFSCMNSNRIIKYVYISLTNGEEIHIHYPTQKNMLTSRVSINKTNGSNITKYFENDDMMKQAYLIMYRSLFMNNTSLFSYRVGGINTQVVIDALTNCNKISFQTNSKSSICSKCHLLCMKMNTHVGCTSDFTNKYEMINI